MKTVKLIGMAMMSMAMIMVSCSGEDGEKGVQGDPGADGTNGIDGVDGSDGISCWDLNGNGTGDAEEDVNNDGNFDALDCQGEDGEDGEDGVDGNANVFRTDLLINEFEGHILHFNLFTFNDFLPDNADLSNYAMFFYLKNPNSFIYPVPGPLSGNNEYTRVYYIEENGDMTIVFYNTADDSQYDVVKGEYIQLKIVAVEALTSTGKSSQENVMSELKAAGVDTSDYNAVAEYFGLE
jgi:hypothetical protein